LAVQQQPSTKQLQLERAIGLEGQLLKAHLELFKSSTVEIVLCFMPDIFKFMSTA
jgi:hypothetical protein